MITIDDEDQSRVVAIAAIAVKGEIYATKVYLDLRDLGSSDEPPEAAINQLNEIIKSSYQKLKNEGKVK